MKPPISIVGILTDGEDKLIGLDLLRTINHHADQAAVPHNEVGDERPESYFTTKVQEFLPKIDYNGPQYVGTDMGLGIS
jgi:hypothetical protein